MRNRYPSAFSTKKIRVTAEVFPALFVNVAS
jgi:hypothetical protein